MGVLESLFPPAPPAATAKYKLLITSDGTAAASWPMELVLNERDELCVWIAHVCKVLHALDWPNTPASQQLFEWLEGVQPILAANGPGPISLLGAQFEFENTERIKKSTLRGRFYKLPDNNWYVETTWGPGVGNWTIAASCLVLLESLYQLPGLSQRVRPLLGLCAKNLVQVYSTVGRTYGTADIKTYSNMALSGALIEASGHA